MIHQEVGVLLNKMLQGMRLVGLEKYMLTVNLLRMLAHFRFVYVRMSVLSVTKDEEEGSVKIRWSIVGLGMLRFCLRYFPDRLWEKGSYQQLSPSYVGGDNKIYRHAVDSVRRGEDKEPTGLGLHVIL